MKLVRILPKLVLAATLCTAAFGVDTAFWQVGSYDEFLQGTLTSLSLSRQGAVTLAPAAEAIFSPDEALALSIARDAQGNIYLGTGHQGKVFRVGPDKKSALVLTTHEPDIFAMAVGPDGNLYVGSSPDGKVYKVTPDGKSSIFYDPKTKYIWALQFDAQGRLYVGTGDMGQIFRVDASGKGELFYDTKQTHVMCLRLDLKGNVLAGSVPNGLIYRISPEGKAFVIYQASLPEVHDLAVDAEGRIFAATLGGAGSKGSPDLLLAPQQGGSTNGVTTITVVASAGSESTAKGQTPPVPSKNPSFNRLIPQAFSLSSLQLGQGRGALVEIFPDSSVETIWSSNSESIFGLALRNHHVLFTTDNNGRIFDLDATPNADNLTILTETHESLATRLLVAGNDLYAATSNVAKLFRIGGAPNPDGTFESQVKDTKFISHWGTLAWRGDVPAGGKLEFFVRSGNSDHPDSTWGDWTGPYTTPDGSAISSAPGRYLQWKAIFYSSGTGSPTLDEATVAYLNQNLPPQIHSLNVSASSERTGAAGVSSSQISAGITVSTVQSMGYSVGAQAGTIGKTPIVLTWQADDPNSDQLTYSVYVKAADERDWHLLKDKISQATYTIDPNSLSDGKYTARLVASDEAANPPNLARKIELQSAPFWVDNTPPEIDVLNQKVSGNEAEVQFAAQDSTSPLRSAEMSEDGKDWHDVLSDDGIVDSRRETFTIKLTHLSPGEHILALRAADTSGNIGVGKVVIRVPKGAAQ